MTFHPRLIRDMTSREIRALRIKVRREQNAIARLRGFKNYAEMAGE